MADTKASFLWAIKQQESGGDYSVVNSSSGAIGAYQVMPSNVASWTKQALGYSLTPAQFRSNPAAQDAVANTILGGYYDKYGARGAAAMWYSGQPDASKTYGNPPVYKYVSDILAKMSSSSPVTGTSPSEAVPADLSGSIGGMLAEGLAGGIKSSGVAILKPVLQWATWSMMCALGLAAMTLGVYLMVKNTAPVLAGAAKLKKMDAEKDKKNKAEARQKETERKKQVRSANVAMRAYQRKAAAADKKRAAAANKAAQPKKTTRAKKTTEAPENA